MISLDKLRKRSGLLIGGIGIAMGAFLLGDLMNSGTTLFNGSQGKLGEVNNELIDYREFETEAQNIDRIFSGGQDRNDLRDNLWADKVNEIIMNKEYKSLGLSISSEELAGLTFGYKSGDMSATARQFFGASNQDVSPEELASVIQRIHDTDPLRWMYFEKVLIKERLSQKYSTLIRQGLTASNIDAQAYYNNQSIQVFGKYLFKPFDMNIDISEAEKKAYYKKQKEDFPQSASRELTIAIFDIFPTKEDKQTIKEELEALINDRVVYNKITGASERVEGFRNTQDIEFFVDTYSDSSFDPTFYAEGQLPPSIETVMRNEDVGFIYGPYEEEESYKIARLSEKRGDSIQVAIIEISIDASEETANEIYAEASEAATAKDLESLESFAEEKNIAIVSSTIKDSDRIVSSIGEARNLVFWAYNEKTELYSVKLEDQNNRIIVAMLTEITEEGSQKLEDVRFQIEESLKREKSGAILKEEFEKNLSTVSSINELSTIMGLNIEQANILSFSSNAIPGGFEPKVVGALYGTEKGKMSKPIIGSGGVYIVSTDSIKQSLAPKEYNSLKKQIASQLQPRVNSEVYNALKDLSSIEDNRAKFY